MRQARAIVVALVVDEDLGLVFEAAKCGGMNDTVAVALERRAHRMRRLGNTPSAAHPRQHRVRRERTRLQLLEILPVSQHPGTRPGPGALVRCYHAKSGSPTRQSPRLSTDALKFETRDTL